MLLNDAGYVSFPDKQFHFYIKDHQGNVRVVTDADGNVEEVNDYYPFGGLMSNATGNEFQRYKYNGKELDRKAGLNWYDYGARFYDPGIGRFMTVDPQSEKLYHWNSYNYCIGNPVKLVDKDGELPQIPPILGWTNPILSTGSRIGMLGTADKVVRALPKEEHHIIPKSLKKNPIVNEARKGGFKLDGKENKIKLDKFNKATGEGQHGKHPQYTEQIRKKLDTKGNDLTPQKAVDVVRDVVKQTKEVIQNNPETKVNDLKLNQQIVPTDNLKTDKPDLIEKLKYIDPNMV